MDRLEEAFNALAAHVDKHGHKGPLNGYDVIAVELGMTLEDVSDGSDIDQSFEMVEDGGTIALSYFLEPSFSDDQPVKESYRLTLTRTGTASIERTWEYEDRKLIDHKPIQKAA